MSLPRTTPVVLLIYVKIFIACVLTQYYKVLLDQVLSVVLIAHATLQAALVVVLLIQNAALNSTDEAFNFNSAQAFVNAANPSQSKLLAEPLVGDGGVASIGPHGGGDIFATTAATCYREILNWASTPNGTCPASCTVLTPTGGSGQLVPADLTSCAP